jgi:hypothetical protein
MFGPNAAGNGISAEVEVSNMMIGTVYNEHYRL